MSENGRMKARVQRPGDIAREVWRQLYRAMRLFARAEDARINHEFLHGQSGSVVPQGILNTPDADGAATAAHDASRELSRWLAAQAGSLPAEGKETK